MSEIKIHNIEEYYDSDCVRIMEAKCPQCGDIIQFTEFGPDFRKCSCGYTWTCELSMTGTKDDKQVTG